MTRLLIKNGLVVTPLEECMTDLAVANNRIVGLGSVESSEDTQEIDAGGCYVTPGLFDIQVNGGPECDFWAELSLDKIASFSRRLISSGVTSILPTLITGSLTRLKENRDFLKSKLGLGPNVQNRSDLFVRMPGIHFEGPCISPQKPGVHPVEHLQPLQVAVLKEFVDDACRLVTLAPELDPEGACLRFLGERGVLAAIGHSNATFAEAQQSFANGVSLMTHTFNALPALAHREPGAVAAALLDESIHCCVIPDGLHVLPPMIELVVKMKGAEKTILVSDMAAIGTSGGGLVGSSLLLSDGVRNMVNWGISSFVSAVRMASYNPAKLFNLADAIGQIKPGAYADLLIWDRRTLAIKQIIFDGSLLLKT